MNAAIARLAPSRQRALAVALLVARARRCALSVVLLPLCLLHKHYDDTIAAVSDRLERYRRVAAQAPEYRKALDAMREKDGRRFFLKNTAPNLAGAELQELRSRRDRGQRRAHHDQPEPGRQGRRPVQADHRHRAVLRVDPRAAEDPARARGAAAVSRGRQHDHAAAQRVPRIQAGARPGARNQRAARRRRIRVRRAGKRQGREPHERLCPSMRGALWWLLPLLALAALIGWETDWGRAVDKHPPPAEAIAPKPVAVALLPEYAIAGGVAARPKRSSARSSIPTRRPAPVAVQAATPRMQRGQFALTGHDGGRREEHGVPARDRRQQGAARAGRRIDQRHARRRGEARPGQAHAGRRVRGARPQGRDQSAADGAARCRRAAPAAAARPPRSARRRRR